MTAEDAPEDRQAAAGVAQTPRREGAPRAAGGDRAPAAAAAKLLQPGRNCWRIERASRFAMLVDGEEYFRALRSALIQAEHTVFILGWDIDSRFELVPGGADDGFPRGLRDFLDALVRRRRRLRVYVLSWDFAMVYAMEREWLPAVKLDWQTHRRLSFRLDARHPVGASHHQKVVVIDHSLAFVGGLDLTRCRWDTPSHALNEPRRVDPDGKPYGPFHDVQAVVEGDVARALGEMAAERWRRGTRREPRAPDPAAGEKNRPLWPDGVAPLLTDVPVAIARTAPAFDGEPGIGEIRALHLDAIAAARQTLYLENQYFSSGVLADALAKRLAEPEGPEVVLVSRRSESGWLEEHSMGVLRARAHRKLRSVDAGHRYRLYYPHLPGEGEPGPDGEPLPGINVHSKVMVVDDSLLTIGSANLNNRSMGLDTECNLVIEAAGDARIAAAIRAMRARLVAEHLGCDADELAAAHARGEALHATIARCHRPGERTLQAFDPPLVPEVDAVVPDERLLDPIEPIDPDGLVDEFLTHEARPRVIGRLGVAILLLVVLAGLAFAWRYTPLREWADFRNVLDVVERIRDMPMAPLAMLGAYVAAGLVMVPVTLLIVVTVVVFGPVKGALCALGGVVLSAATGYGIGRFVGRDAVRRYGGKRLNALSQQVGQHGLLAMVVLRLVPVAPFTLVNLVVGASRIRFRDCLLGTLIGMTPGIVISASLVDRIAAVARNPNPLTVALLLLVLLIPLSVLWLLRRRRRADAAQAAKEAEAAQAAEAARDARIAQAMQPAETTQAVHRAAIGEPRHGGHA
ncbi:VTT domain-containing protein [Cupriavidus gilardii]|uniref:VTT domain-containing protein n=1 Tax=Cupriavidus gilardii TaxID=82541 RepID=UPI0015732415|nr:VTT domain-containing protein [Cupriavidus gilardii]NSX06804.1 VTT domain-containing protein [Cupriavidus gilardii]